MKHTDTGGLRGACPSCPFNDGYTEEAAIAQNYGCLPTGYDIVQLKRRTDQNWACHDDESRVCAGLCHQASTEGLDLSSGGLVRYSSWYHDGEDAAVQEARTGYLLRLLSGERFDASFEGRRVGGGLEEPTHFTPTLRYWYRESPLRHLRGEPDTRLAFTASTAPQFDPDSGRHLRKYVALLETETAPYDSKELWVKYVSVDPAHQRKGLAAALLARVIEHARQTGQWLSVSYATDEGKEKLQAHLVRTLQASGLRWSQSRS